MKSFLLTSLCLLGLSSFVYSQSLYTVQVGTFTNVKSKDFDQLRPLGFVYAINVNDDLTQVFMGDYSDQAAATTMATELRRRGYNNAQIMQKPLDQGQNITMIQLATRYVGKSIDWETLELAGQLFAVVDGDMIKILHGPFDGVTGAAAQLPAIRALGYADAFVKGINSRALIPISEFETGLKKPLIPIQLTERQPVARTTSQPGTTIRPQAGRPADYERNEGRIVTAKTPAAPAATIIPNEYDGPVGARAIPEAAVETVDLPAIRGRVKRTSALDIQRVMKQAGYYNGSLDGYYGPGTTEAYETALSEDPVLRKYAILNRYFYNETEPTVDAFLNWPEVQLLRAIAMDIGTSDNPELDKEAASRRTVLYLATQPLDVSSARAADAWHTELWKSLNSWGQNDPLHADIVQGMKISYFQTQARLEDYFMDQGFPVEEAKELAKAALQAIVGSQLDRFL